MGKSIYDDTTFFEGYRALRQRQDNHNVLLEQPAMSTLLPNLEGKTVLDLGCGFGQNCMEFIERGAEQVVGVDLSQRMLHVAGEENAHPRITYLHMAMEDIATLKQSFHLVYSSLAFHYVEKFPLLLGNVHALLEEEGILLYSQEHPITTATKDGLYHWNMDEEGVPQSFTISNYHESGERHVAWFVEDVKKYHRPMGEIVTALFQCGFHIQEMVEPLPSQAAIAIRPEMERERLRPSFLLIRAQKY